MCLFICDKYALDLKPNRTSSYLGGYFYLVPKKAGSK